VISNDTPLTPAERRRWEGYNRAVEASAIRRYRESLRADPRQLRADEEGRRGAIGFTVSEAATVLGVSTGSIRRWADIGRLETTRTPGGQRRFSQAQIDAFLGSLSPLPRASLGPTPIQHPPGASPSNQEENHP
jgi:excisionase family DNA binding protein